MSIEMYIEKTILLVKNSESYNPLPQKKFWENYVENFGVIEEIYLTKIFFNTMLYNLLNITI